jgi:hypothetical protein
MMANDFDPVRETFGDLLDTRPARVTLIRSPGQEPPEMEAFPVLLNPETFTEAIEVEWARLQVIGLDHQVPHYTNTRSLEYPLTFYWSSFQAGRGINGNPPRRNSNVGGGNLQDPVPDLGGTTAMAFANFMRSLCFPTRRGLRPPTVRIEWPNVFSILGVVTSLSLNFIKFDQTLAPLIYEAEVSFLETRVTRRFSDDVRKSGIVAESAATVQAVPTRTFLA